jgi:hypothetical protein
MRHLLDANVCVARNAGFYTPFHTERAAEGLQKTPHKTPCRGTIHLAWSAYRPFNSLLFRSQLTKTIRGPSVPPRTRPSRKSCATALSCVEPRRSEKASVKNKSNRWCHRRCIHGSKCTAPHITPAAEIMCNSTVQPRVKASFNNTTYGFCRL